MPVFSGGRWYQNVDPQVGFQWITPPSEAWGQLGRETARAYHDYVYSLAALRAYEIENYMKANAPWTDRTGNARQGLFVQAEEAKYQWVALTLAHSMDYGIWLEIRWAGRYAIINPSIDHWGPEIMNNLRAILE